MTGLETVSTLILDDNAHMRQLLNAMLSAFGVRDIYEAADSAAAFAILETKGADIVFVDLKHGHFAQFGGVEFCQELRRRPEDALRFLPLIVVTAYSEVTHLRQAIDAGVDEFLVKPVSPTTLATRMNAVILRRRPFVSSSDYFGPTRRRREDKKFKGPFRRYDDSNDVEL